MEVPENEGQHEAMIARIQELLPMVSNATPVNDRNMIELVVITKLAEKYEETFYQVELPVLPEIIRHKMTSRGITQKVLAELPNASPSGIVGI